MLGGHFLLLLKVYQVFALGPVGWLSFGPISCYDDCVVCPLSGWA